MRDPFNQKQYISLENVSLLLSLVLPLRSFVFFIWNLIGLITELLNLLSTLKKTLFDCSFVLNSRYILWFNNPTQIWSPTVFLLLLTPIFFSFGVGFFPFHFKFPNFLFIVQLFPLISRGHIPQPPTPVDDWSHT